MWYWCVSPSLSLGTTSWKRAERTNVTYRPLTFGRQQIENGFLYLQVHLDTARSTSRTRALSPSPSTCSYVADRSACRASMDSAIPAVLPLDQPRPASDGAPASDGPPAAAAGRGFPLEEGEALLSSESVPLPLPGPAAVGVLVLWSSSRDSSNESLPASEGHQEKIPGK